MNDLKTKKEIFDEICKNLRADLNLKYDLKSLENEIKDEYCSIHQLKNKNGDNDLKQVKFAILKLALELQEDPNKKDTITEKFDYLEEYKDNINKGEEEFPIDKGKKYIKLMENKKDLKKDLKEIKATAIEKEIEEIEIQALTQIAKVKLNIEEENLKEKLAKEEGKEYTPKTKSELDIKIQELIKELGISI